MLTTNTDTLFVDFDHLKTFDEDLVKVIVRNFHYLDPYLRKAVEEFTREISMKSYEHSFIVEKRPFFVSFYNLPMSHCCKLRDLNADLLGKLVSFSGIVTKTSEVRPELLVATFRCDECSTVIKNIEQDARFTKPCICPNLICGNTKTWTLIREACVFCDWQKALVQELSTEVPGGAVPRSLSVIFRGDNVECVRSGEEALFTGSLIVLPNFLNSNNENKYSQTEISTDFTNETNFSKVYRITYRFSFLCNYVKKFESRYTINLNQRLTDISDENVRKMRKDPEIFAKLATCLTPHVFGHIDVKKSICLIMIGGVHKTNEEGFSLRGNIHALLLGDPSSAKSQFLKYVTRVFPQTVYVSGRGSTAAGLTAYLTKDPDTHEYMLEAGALMLADGGVCCMDEFDKIDDQDKSAIHEVMEQQTISLTKAGVQANLNARASILAAANPVGGRYLKGLPFVDNLYLSPSILSCFGIVRV
jgi:DNA replication licensing factor MCM6